jgi:hypothetical protein
MSPVAGGVAFYYGSNSEAMIKGLSATVGGLTSELGTIKTALNITNTTVV